MNKLIRETSIVFGLFICAGSIFLMTSFYGMPSWIFSETQRLGAMIFSLVVFFLGLYAVISGLKKPKRGDK